MSLVLAMRGATSIPLGSQALFKSPLQLGKLYGCLSAMHCTFAFIVQCSPHVHLPPAMGTAEISPTCTSDPDMG